MCSLDDFLDVPSTLPRYPLDLLDNIGQWVSITVKGKLSGGYAPAAVGADGKPVVGADVQEIRVNLRAYLCQL